MYEIRENSDGTVSVRSAFSGRVVQTCATRAEADAWIEAKVLADDAAEQRSAQGLRKSCRYCGLPTTRGVCRECGPEI